MKTEKELIEKLIKDYDKNTYEGHFEELFGRNERSFDLGIMLLKIFQEGKKQALEDVKKIIHDMDMKENWDFDVLIQQINKLEKNNERSNIKRND